MRHRLYFVLPHLNAARRTMEDLLLARIEERHIHFLAKPGIPMDDLHEANILQSSDIVHGFELGIIIGGVGGIILGAFMVFSPPGDISFPPAVALLTTLGGAFFGAWVSSLTAARIPNSQLTPFIHDIEAGRYLMMVDVPTHRMEEIRTLIERCHPEATQHGLEPAMPVFP